MLSLLWLIRCLCSWNVQCRDGDRCARNL